MSLRRLADSVVVTNRLFTIKGNVAVYKVKFSKMLLKLEQKKWRHCERMQLSFVFS